MQINAQLQHPDDEAMEHLIVEYRPLRAKAGTQITLKVWADRWIWIDARAAGASGWEWEWSREGRLIADEIGRELVRAFERSVDSQAISVLSAANELDKIWKPIVVDGQLSLVFP